MSKRIIDITPLVSERLGVWPGDVAYQRTVNLDIEKGFNITLSALESTVHLGAHVDAPNHYQKGGCGIDRRPLDLYMGSCQVVTIEKEAGSRIGADDLKEDIQAPRVLFRTNSFPHPESFNEDFNALSKPLIDKLASRGVRLVGIDTPSVDLIDDEALESHHAIASHDMAILEGVVLNEVQDGLYDLIALPLKLEGADASPVRAILIADDSSPP